MHLHDGRRAPYLTLTARVIVLECALPAVSDDLPADSISRGMVATITKGNEFNPIHSLEYDGDFGDKRLKFDECYFPVRNDAQETWSC